MRCRQILVKYPHWVRGRTRTDSMYVVEVEPHDLWEVTKLIGESYVDYQSMELFRNWQQFQSDQIVLLVSLDFKYVVVAQRVWGEHLNTWDVIDLEPGGHWIDISTVQDLKPYLIDRIAAEPELAPYLGHKPRRQARSAALPKRLDFTSWHVFEFDPLDMTMSSRHSLRTAPDYCLVWLHLIKDELADRDPEFNPNTLQGELSERSSLGSSNPDPYYTLEGLSTDELEARRVRAKRFLAKIAPVLEGSEDQAEEQIMVILRQLKTADQAAELLIYTCWEQSLQKVRGQVSLAERLIWSRMAELIHEESPSFPTNFNWSDF